MAARRPAGTVAAAGFVVAALGLAVGCASQSGPSGAPANGPEATPASHPAATPSGRPPGTPTRTATSPPGEVRVFARDDGRVVTVHVGQHLVVRLAGRWTPPRPAPPGGDLPGTQLGPLSPQRARAGSPPGYATADLLAVRPGTTVVTARPVAPRPGSAVARLSAAQPYRLTVRVLPHADAGGGAQPLPLPR